MLHFASLILGLIALALPIAALVKRSADPRFSHISHCACLLSLFCIIRYYDYMVLKGDWSSLLDTSEVSRKLSFLLLITVMVLNVINYMVNQKSRT